MVIDPADATEPPARDAETGEDGLNQTDTGEDSEPDPLRVDPVRQRHAGEDE